MKLKYMKKVLAISLVAAMLAGPKGSTMVFAEETTQGMEAEEAVEETEGVTEAVEETEEV